jgi:heat shock protein HslJ
MVVAGSRHTRLLFLAPTAIALALLAGGCAGSASPAPSGGVAGIAGSPGASGAAIDGRWALTNYTSPSGTQYTVPSAVTPMMVFNGNAANGRAGCNTFNAIVTLGTESISFSQVQRSKEPCQDPAATVENAFFQALNLSTTYKVQGDTLVLSGPRGVPALIFIRGS